MVDKVECGICGYDGGKSHLEEKLQWQQELNEASKLSDTTRETRYISVAITTVLCTAIMSFGYCQTRPENQTVEQPIVTKMSYLKSMYEKCIAYSQNVEKEDRANIMTDCNKSFGEELRAFDFASDAGVVK